MLHYRKDKPNVSAKEENIAKVVSLHLQEFEGRGHNLFATTPLDPPLLLSWIRFCHHPSVQSHLHCFKPHPCRLFPFYTILVLTRDQFLPKIFFQSPRSY